VYKRQVLKHKIIKKEDNREQIKTTMPTKLVGMLFYT
jgi:hypothetical protein